ncbi:hypothetical protein N7535_002469 [Penicillium sp. DV-2018c]|nr:hypothetical protein N7461_001848 [Penicillium sp. DV-2018c]KAJ5575543.1 hypothetical protein N7535_002469 [Penicillium sp. DV-2018c]
MALGPKDSGKAQLSTEQRPAIVYAHKDGATQTKLAADFGCTRKTIYNTLQRHSEEGKLENREKSGRPPIFDTRATRLIKLQARRHPFWTYKQLRAACAPHPSPSTVRRILRRFGISKCRSKQKIPIKPSLARTRLRFARKWRRESFQSWIFSDECSVQRTSNFGPQWCFRKTSEGLRKELVNAKVHVKDISQMVWGAIWLGGRSNLIIMERDEESPSQKGYTSKSYIEALEKGLLPCYTPGAVFQQDNAKIHTAFVTQEWFERHGIYVEEWPPHSPDLNPIEPVWRWLKVKLFELFPELIDMGRSEADWEYFKRCLVAAWDALDQSKIDALILSMGRRLRAVRVAKGYYTKY